MFSFSFQNYSATIDLDFQTYLKLTTCSLSLTWDKYAIVTSILQQVLKRASLSTDDAYT